MFALLCVPWKYPADEKSRRVPLNSRLERSILYLDIGKRFALIMPPIVSLLFADTVVYFKEFKDSDDTCSFVGGKYSPTVISKARIPEYQNIAF